MDWTARILKNWAILSSEAPEMDRLTVLSYLSGFDEKYHAQIRRMDEYAPAPAAYSGWVTAKCVDSMVSHITMQMRPSLRLFADYELCYAFYYLEFLFRAKCTVLDANRRRFNVADTDKLDELINPRLAQMKKRKAKKKGAQ